MQEFLNIAIKGIFIAWILMTQIHLGGLNESNFMWTLSLVSLNHGEAVLSGFKFCVKQDYLV